MAPLTLAKVDQKAKQTADPDIAATLLHNFDNNWLSSRENPWKHWAQPSEFCTIVLISCIRLKSFLYSLVFFQYTNFCFTIPGSQNQKKFIHTFIIGIFNWFDNLRKFLSNVETQWWEWLAKYQHNNFPGDLYRCTFPQPRAKIGRAFLKVVQEINIKGY